MATRNEKKEIIEQIAQEYMETENLEEKSMAIMVMSAYIEGKDAGKAEERSKWENKEKEPVAT